ncbi:MULTISPECIES: ComEA family DNA-binding protein [Enorma]|uniref:ComEA family DNA-binding protein n=1 Tax=Enorma TaxID=1472762 RepID=UPI00034899A5|nr:MULTISPECIES: ComEA family DNA-binding protein [Enorma]
MAQIERTERGGRIARRVRTLLVHGGVARAVLALVLAAVVAMVWLGVAGGSGRSFELSTGSADGTGAGSLESAEQQGAVEEAGEQSGDTEDGAVSAPERIVIDVGGAVAQPGVVELTSGARVVDAIEAAGGLADDADCSSLNRAQVLQDGQKVYVPRAGEAVPAATGSGTDVSAGAGDVGALVNINTASLEELDALPGVGPSTAQAIIDDREQNGPFASIEDLMRVSGIGEKKYAKLEALICI